MNQLSKKMRKQFAAVNQEKRKGLIDAYVYLLYNVRLAGLVYELFGIDEQVDC